jgi:hypothetical protein
MRSTITLISAALLTISFSSLICAQSKSREQLIEEIAAKRTELSTLEQQFLAVSETDRTAFADLLSQPNTGLIRLLPREVFDSETYKKNKKTLTMRGGGAYYSFVRLTHEYGQGSDISLNSDYLSVGFAGVDYGMLMKLGDISLQDLSSDHPLVMPLGKYNPPTSETDARLEQRRFSTGSMMDGLSLKGRVPVEVNATYLLRSISYERSDVLVAMRVVRKDSDGSVIIAWKLLQKYSPPQLARN